MRTAIDRLHLGKEREVDIYDYDGYKQEYRFVCPECGEYIFPAVGKRNSFKHYKKKDVECDRRVDGQTSCTYYERVGLSLYLQRHNNIFELKIGFAPLNEKILSLAVAKKAQIIVCSGSNCSDKSIFNIDNIGFSSDFTTLKTIDFVPFNDHNYKISISDCTIEKQVFEQWSDYADGFTSYGALFTYSESIGKKIRKNDTIEANANYYWIVPQGYFKPKSGLTHKLESTLCLKKRMFDIYSIAVQHKNEQEFIDLADFFWTYLRVKLLYIKPEIISIWPPVIQAEQYLLSLKLNPKNSATFCRVKSDCDEPAVYRYFGKDYSRVSVYGDMNQPKWANLVLDSYPQPFTVDRKYLANSTVLCQKQFSFSSETNEVLLILSDSDAIPLKNEISIEQNCNKLVINTKKRIAVICWYRNKACEIFEILSEQSSIILLGEKCTDIWIIEKACSNLICRISKRLESKNGNSLIIDDTTLFKSFKKNINEPIIPIPRKYKKLIHLVKNYPKYYSLLVPYIMSGEIQPFVLKTIIDGGMFNE